MKFKPVLGSELSGSIGGITASHNMGGAYLRNRVVPTNPNTPQQQAVRSIVGQLTSLWLNTLTAGQRSEWETYAVNVPLLDKLGEPINVSGLNMYVRSNTPRLQAGLPRVDAGPGTFNLGDFTAISIDTVSVALQTFSVNFTVGDDWVSEDDAALLLYISRPRNLSINYFRGPYRYTGMVEGDNGAPPASPHVNAVAFSFGLGQRVFFRTQVTRVDGRLSLSQYLFQATVA